MYNRKLALVADILWIVGVILIVFVKDLTGYGCIMVASGLLLRLALIVKYWLSTK